MIDHLRPLDALLVLDNCEHLIDDCAQFAYQLLAGCDQLHILATSREPLHIAGETTWLVPTLTLPDWQPGQPLERLRESEAVQLFIERLQSIRPTFALDEQTAPAVVDICNRLDGIPLALELASAGAGNLSLDDLATRVDGAFGWLTSADRLAPPRQQTLRAALDWSYNLLQPGEQALFRRLSVFLGGFTLAAAEQVCIGDEVTVAEVPSLLYRLVDTSFITRVDAVSGSYRLLEVIRQYGLEKLDHAGETQTYRDHHFHWALDFAKHAAGGVISAERSTWTTEVEAQLPNLRQALRWGLSASLEARLVHELVSALTQFWQLRGYFREAAGWINAVLARAGDVPPHILSYTYLHAFFIFQHLWDLDRARQYGETAITLFEQIGSGEGAAMMQALLATNYISRRDFERARALTEDSLTFYQASPPRFGAAISWMCLGDIAFLEGDYPLAQQHYTQSLAICEQIGNDLGSARRNLRLAQVATALGETERAQAILTALIETRRSTGDRWLMAMMLISAAFLAWRQGSYTHAARCLGISRAFEDSFGTHHWTVDRAIAGTHERLLLDQLGDKTYRAAFAEGCSIGADHQRALDYILNGLRTTPPAPASRTEALLTPRETEVAELIAQGKNNAEIARALFVGMRTVETHITHILTKLNFTSRTQIAVWMREHAAPES